MPLMPCLSRSTSRNADPVTLTMLKLECSTVPWSHMEAALCLRVFQVQHEMTQPRRHVYIQIITTDATVSTQNLKPGISKYNQTTCVKTFQVFCDKVKRLNHVWKTSQIYSVLPLNPTVSDYSCVPWSFNFRNKTIAVHQPHYNSYTASRLHKYASSHRPALRKYII